MGSTLGSIEVYAEEIGTDLEIIQIKDPTFRGVPICFRSNTDLKSVCNMLGAVGDYSNGSKRSNLSKRCLAVDQDITGHLSITDGFNGIYIAEISCLRRRG